MRNKGITHKRAPGERPYARNQKHIPLRPRKSHYHTQNTDQKHHHLLMLQLPTTKHPQAKKHNLTNANIKKKQKTQGKELKEKKNIYKVGVIGTGRMRFGIAEYILKSGYFTLIKTQSKKEAVISKFIKRLSKDHTEEQLNKIMEKLTVTSDYSKMKECDIIIEAVPENIDTKKIVFIELSKYCNEDTIFATNTSSISIDDIASSTDRPEKFIGMHFFNPVSKMDLIEVVIGNKTSEETQKWISNFSHELQKIPIIVKHSPGFIVNRLLLPQINEAVLLLEEKKANKEDIDKAMKLGLNHPMGPFQLADFIGIDICLSILETIHKNIGDEKYKPANTLVKMVKNGKLGFKTGEGFYKY